jgi:hypothetical protein
VGAQGRKFIPRYLYAFPKKGGVSCLYEICTNRAHLTIRQ